MNEAVVAYFRPEAMSYFVARSVRDKFRGNEANHLDQIANRLFAQAFPLRVSSNFHLMNLNSTQGNSKVADVARYLFKNDGDFGVLDTAAKNLAVAVLHEGQDRWGVLMQKNRLQEPKDERVVHSWRELDGAVLEDRPVTFSQLNERLRGMPFGHDDYTLTLLYAAWIGSNKNELIYVGSLGGRDAADRQISLAEFQDKIKKAKEFIKWLGEGKVRIQRPHKNARRRATEYLKQIENVTEYEKAAKLVGKFDEVIATLGADSEVRGKILEWARKLGAEIKTIHDHTKTLQELRGRIEKTHVVRDLLTISADFPKPPETTLSFDESQQIEIRKLLNARIEAEVEKQTQQALGRRDQYGAVKNSLREMKDALRRSGRQDFEQMCVAALERIDAEYEALEAVEGFKADEADLAASRNQATRVKELLDTKLSVASENTRARIERSLQQVNKRVTSLQEWVAALPQRTEEATDLTSARVLRDEIIKRERDYAGTPESDTMHAHRAALEEKERSLLDQAAQQAARQATVTAYMRPILDDARRAEKAQSFEAAVQELTYARASAAAPENVLLTDAEQGDVQAALNRAEARVEVLYRDLTRPRQLSEVFLHQRCSQYR